MKSGFMRGLCAVVAVSVAGATWLGAEDAGAQGRKQPTPAPAPAAVDPPMVKNANRTIPIQPDGLHWGMSPEQLCAFYERLIDQRYRPLYKKAQPGPQTDRLDAAVANAKAAFRQSTVEFGELPTGLDSSALKGEYTYRNGESMMKIERRGIGTRYFFFIAPGGGTPKLWKIYDEIALAENGQLGATFQDAVGKLAVQYQVIGRVQQPDYDTGRMFTEVDWRDDKTHLRVLDRSGLKMVAVVYEDRSVLANLASYRTNKPATTDAIDPEIQALVRPPSTAPGPQPKKEDDKSKEKKKR